MNFHSLANESGGSTTYTKLRAHYPAKVSIVAVVIAVTDEVDARVREVGGIAARSLGSESGGSEINTTGAGRDVAHACQSSVQIV